MANSSNNTHWLNRPLPVDRLAAYQPNPQVQNRPAGAEERQQRMEALRRQLRYPHALADSTLRWHLNRTDWNVNLAARSFWEEQANPPNPNPLLQAPRNGVRRAPTVGRARRNMVQDRLTAERTRTGSLPTGYTEMAMLHNDNQWNFDEVTQEVARRNGDYHDLTERTNALRAPGESATLDERLALLISITSTSSWFSARDLLERHDWDLAHAVEEWMRLGEVPYVEPGKKRKRTGEQVPRYENNGMRLWNPDQPRRVIGTQFEPPATPVLAPVNDYTPEAESRPISQRPTVATTYSGPVTRLRAADVPLTTNSTRRGFLLDDVVYEQAYVGVPDETKLRFEFIEKGEYRTRLFTGSLRDNGANIPFRWDDNNDPALANSTVEFDWYNSTHVSKLNRWRSTAFRFITGEELRGELIEYNKYENQWLLEQECERNEEKFYEEAGQDPTDAGITDQTRYDAALRNWASRSHFPVNLTQAELLDLTDRFNHQFAGKSVYLKQIERTAPDSFRVVRTDYLVKGMGGKVGTIPRPRRTWLSIGAQRRRIKALAKHFMLGADMDEEDSERDSDFDSDASDDSEDSDNDGTDDADESNEDEED